AVLQRLSEPTGLRTHRDDDQDSMSLRAFTGVARTLRLAGLPLITVGCLVKGLTPGRSSVAGVAFAFSLTRLGIVTSPGPCGPSSFLIKLASASRTPFTAFLSRPASWASVAMICALVSLFEPAILTFFLCSLKRAPS